MRTVDLKTPFEKETGWEKEYPRPQFKRESYISLCGEWELFTKGGAVGKITVPFPPESRISGIKKQYTEYGYRRTFRADGEGRLILHFGAADQKAEVFINGTGVGQHIGGYLPFEFDITDCVQDGDNEIEVMITDTLDTDLPYGKQRKKRGGMWYTAISGLWQSVWLERVPENAIESIVMESTTESVTVTVRGGRDKKVIELESGERYEFEGKSVTIKPQNPRTWAPEHPHLYNFTLSDGVDKIESYFALRTIEIKKVNGTPYICLNGKPYFFHGLLDQGYYSDGIYTPASPKGLEWDVITMKRLGFNTLRKHIKIEPELFYYYCDKHGMIVFQDMVNSGKYRYIRDTVLPTLGFKRRIEKRAKKRAERFTYDSVQTVKLLYNHPSVCYYTIFNEGWGQYEADNVYRTLKAFDTSRVWDATSGWFAGRESDVVSEHVYFRKVSLKSSDRPLVLSEFGGYSCKIKGHSFNLKKEYGYKKCTDCEHFGDLLSELYRNEIIPAIQNGLNAAVLTQVSDVEDETNGLVTYDRQIIKVNETKMRNLAKEIQDAFERSTHE